MSEDRYIDLLQHPKWKERQYRNWAQAFLRESEGKEAPTTGGQVIKCMAWFYAWLLPERFHR